MTKLDERRGWSRKRKRKLDERASKISITFVNIVELDEGGDLSRDREMKYPNCANYDDAISGKVKCRKSDQVFI